MPHEVSILKGSAVQGQARKRPRHSAAGAGMRIDPGVSMPTWTTLNGMRSRPSVRGAPMQAGIHGV